LEWAFSRTDGDDEAGDPKGTLKVEGRHGPRTILKVRLGPGLRWEIDESVVVARDPGTRERILAHLDRVNAWQMAEEVAAGTGIKLKTIQNVLAGMRKEAPEPFATAGSGTKNDPRRYRTLSLRFDGFGSKEGIEMVPPDPPPYRGTTGGNHFREASGEAGNDRYTR
jgi:hypothetical protein